MIRRFLLILLLSVVMTGSWGYYMIFHNPRPEDTTQARVFEGDPTSVDYCTQAELDGSGQTANDIPKAFTPGCGWTTFPMPGSCSGQPI